MVLYDFSELNISSTLSNSLDGLNFSTSALTAQTQQLVERLSSSVQGDGLEIPSIDQVVPMYQKAVEEASSVSTSAFMASAIGSVSQKMAEVSLPSLAGFTQGGWLNKKPSGTGKQGDGSSLGFNGIAIPSIDKVGSMYQKAVEEAASVSTSALVASAIENVSQKVAEIPLPILNASLEAPASVSAFVEREMAIVNSIKDGSAVIHHLEPSYYAALRNALNCSRLA